MENEKNLDKCYYPGCLGCSLCDAIPTPGNSYGNDGVEEHEERKRRRIAEMNEY